MGRERHPAVDPTLHVRIEVRDRFVAQCERAVDVAATEFGHGGRYRLALDGDELDSAFTIADRITILDRGNILIIGTVEEIRNSENERVQNLLNRRFEEEILDPDEYLARLTGEELRD